MASDLISRQETLDALDLMCDVICPYSKKLRDVMCGACAMSGAFDVIRDQPSAQPHTEEEIQKIQELEQAELEKAFELGREDAQPEIIRCKDCKHMTEHYDTDGNAPYWTCSEWDAGTDYDGFCYYAERR